MKKLLLLLLLLSSYISFSQYNIATENGNTINTCAATLVDSGGTGGDYLVSENYSVTFCSTSPGQTIQIDFTAFDIESGFDFVNIYDGNSIAAPLLASYTGDTIPAAAIGTTANATDCLTFEFISDAIVPDVGFEATISCTAPVTGPITMQNGSSSVCTGTFMDSGGFGDYIANENFIYTLCPSTAGQAIELNFSDITIDATDTLIIYDGNSTGASVLSTFSGVWGLNNIVLTGTTANATGCLTIEFVSDATWESAGWNATIDCVVPVTPPYLMQTTSVSTCSGTFADSGYFGTYSANENNVMTICPTVVGQAVELDFSDITIDATDTMTVYDGNSTGAPVLAIFSGVWGLNNIVLTGTTANATGCLTIEFVSDATTQTHGWLATINCVAPVTPPYLMQDAIINTCSGQFADSGYLGNYSANENYTMTFCPDTPGQAMQLDFTSFTTDREDYMVIYDDNVVNYETVLGTYNGSSLATPFTVTGTTSNASGCLTVTFVSNNNAFEDLGWLADISCVVPVGPSACQGTSNGVSTAGCAAVVSGGLGLGNIDPTPVSCVAASTCTDIEANYLDLGDTSDYRVESIAYAPPYQFDCLKVPVSVGTDDVWSPPVNLPFDFCFYGNTYSQCVIGSNGTISFDLTNNTPGGSAGYSYANSLPSVVGDLFENTIYGVYHDLDPSKGGEVGYELITLNTGCRALVVAWHDVPMFSNNALLFTGMMVLYENTNIIEVYIEEKNIDGTWNGGNAIVGVQNVGATQAVVPTNRNGLDADWTTTNEAWRFVPDGTSITTLAWYEGPTATGAVISTAPTLNVCPITTTTYTAEVTYTLCDGSVITDTESTTVAVESCATDVDFDGNNDFIDATSFMGGYGAATQMSWIHLDTNFGVPVAVNGNGNTAVGGLNSVNATGVINAAGTSATVGGVSAKLDNANDSLTLTLDHTVPLGTTITVSLARDRNQGDIAISDGTNTVNFSAGPNDVLQHISFVTGQATNTLIFTRNDADSNNRVWIDGVDYNYISGGDAMVMGQPNNKLWIDTAGTLSGSVVTNTGTFTVTTTTTIPNDLWAHVCSVYDGANLKLYINGVEEASVAIGGGNLDVDTYRYAIGKDSEFDNCYFNGFIQESRVYDLALTESQLREQIYQPIQNNGGNVHGSIVPKDIDGGSLLWSNLVLYLEMNTVAAGLTTDTSGSGVLATVYNVATAQNRTAPIPYVANTSGSWTATGTWEYGNVWDITSLPNKDWAIVQVTNNSKVTTTASHTHLGLLVDSGSELEIQNDQLLQNTSYLKLDGQIDLVDESQLIQTTNSDLDITSAGYLERDQQGQTSIYNYNFWSSPVNPINTTANNTDYSIAGILKDGTTAATPQTITFNTSGYDGASGSPITLADYWMFKYVNQPDLYANWVQIRSTGTLKVGEGYTQKGTGAATGTQNYVFSGKPNNGIIQHTIGANNVYLVGNPYASALDADQFINDNLASVENAGDVIGSGSSTGALYFWEHFSTNNSHVFAAYEGGYATYNLAGGVIAIPDPDVSSNGAGTIRPGRYVPVAQGFFVQGSPTGGTIEFNNGQRAYKRESIFADDSVFTKTASEAATQEISTNTADLQRVYFKFTTPEGPQRELLLAVKEGLADGLNYGYDARMLDDQVTDCAWVVKGETEIEDEKLVIQGIGAIYEDLELPLQIKVGTEGICKFEVQSLADLDPSLEMYFLDAVLNLATKLEAGVPVEFNLGSGEYNDRFYVVFKAAEVLAIDDVDVISDDLVVFYNAATGSIMINSSSVFTAKKVSLYNVLGQQVLKTSTDYTNVTEISIPVQVATGTYLVTFDYNNGTTVTKKVLIK